MSSAPLVTVRMSAYNHEQYVERAILSIVNQTYENIQLVVIDDGSSDETPNILQRLSAQYGFFFERQQNMGNTATHNKIIREYAQGKYIKGCASDDELPPDAIAQMVALLEENLEYGACYGHAYKIDRDSEVVGKMIGSGHSGWIYEDVMLGNAQVPLQTFMWKTDLLKSLGAYNENVVTEDIDMFYRVVKATQIGFVDDFVYRYRKHETNLSKDRWRMYQDSKLLVESREFDDLKLKEAYIRRHHLYWFHSLSQEYKKEAMKYFLTAVRFFPSRFFLAGCLNLLGFSWTGAFYKQAKHRFHRLYGK